MLTQKELNVLAYINTHIEINGVSPTYEHITKHLNIKSKSFGHKIVSNLITKGYLLKKPNTKNGIQVLIPPPEKEVVTGDPLSPQEMSWCMKNPEEIRKIIPKKHDKTAKIPEKNSNSKESHTS